MAKPDTQQAMTRAIPDKSKLGSPYPEQRARITNTPADMSSVTLVGKAQTLEKTITINPKPDSQTTDSEMVSLNNSITDVEPDKSVAVNEQEPLPRLDINIPAVDMISASSAAVNSIADFLEFDSVSKSHTKIGVQPELPLLDVNNSNDMSDGEDGHDVNSMSESSHGQPPSIASFDDVEQFSISVDIHAPPQSS